MSRGRSVQQLGGVRPREPVYHGLHDYRVDPLTVTGHTTATRSLRHDLASDDAMRSALQGRLSK